MNKKPQQNFGSLAGSLRSSVKLTNRQLNKARKNAWIISIMQKGYKLNASRSRQIVQEWFPLEEEVWQKYKKGNIFKK